MKFNPEVKVCLDAQKITVRPPKNDRSPGSVPNQIAGRIFKKENEVELTYRELAEKLTEGHTVLPMTTNGKSCQEKDFESIQTFLVDFECRQPPKVFKERLEFYRLPWKFFYTTLSNTVEDPRFRVVFDMGKPITDYAIASSIQLLLTKHLFPESDKQCKNANRWYYGGKEILFPNYKSRPLNYQELELAALNHQISIGSNDTRSKNRVAKDTIESLTLDMSDRPEIKTIRGADITELCSKIKILETFVMGGYEAGIGYLELFGLATNLQYIEGGLKWMKQVMDFHKSYEPKHYAIFPSIKGRNYKPSKLDNFSPFEEDWEYTTILQATYCNQFAQPVTVANYVRWAYRREDAEVILKTKFQKAIQETSKKGYVFRCATGLGKTEEGVQILINSKEPIVYAVPTHDLKDEIATERLGLPTFDELLAMDRDERKKVLYNLPVYVTPKLPDCIPKNIRDELEYYYRVGLYQKAQNRIAEIKKENSINSELTNRLDLYFEMNALAYGQTHKSVLTTIAKVLTRNQKDGNYPFGHCKTIIFDEDPINEILCSYYVTREDFHRLAKLIQKYGSEQLKEDYLPIIEDYQTYISKGCKTVETIKTVLSNSLSELVSLVGRAPAGHFSGNVLDIFRLKGFYVNDETISGDNNGKMHYAHKKDFPSDRKIIILSATANERLYTHLLGNRLEFIQLDNVIPEGNLVQDMSKSCSKTSMAIDSTLDYVVEKVGDLPTITFKDYKTKFRKPADAHFGKCEGFDDLKGKNIAVAGTPYPSPNQVFIIACAMGLDLSPDHRNTTELIVTRNGYRFKLQTFEEQMLQEIQCALIESNLIQAIGRARLLRFDCTVYLYSNYPIPSYKEDDVVVLKID